MTNLNIILNAYCRDKGMKIEPLNVLIHKLWKSPIGQCSLDSSDIKSRYNIMDKNVTSYDESCEWWNALNLDIKL